jgi:hypothetical protein
MTHDTSRTSVVYTECFDVQINIERQKKTVIVKSQMNFQKMGEENFDVGTIYFVILFGTRKVICHCALLFLPYAHHTAPYSKFSLSVAVSNLCIPYRPRTVTSHCPLLFLPYTHHTVPVQ